MDIRLDDLDLIKVIRDSPAAAAREIRSVSKVDVRAERSIVELVIPGSEGNVQQDMGRESIRMILKGEFRGPDARKTLEALQVKYDATASLPFISDLSGVTEVNRVIIERFDVDEVAGMPNRYLYSMVLSEFREPREPVDEAAPDQSEEAKKAAEGEAAEAMETVNYVTGRVLDADGNPKEGVDVVISGGGAEYRATTDVDGVYSQDGLTPGRYVVKVDSEEYRDIEEEVVVGGG